MENISLLYTRIVGLKRLIMMRLDPLWRDRDELSYALEIWLALSPKKVKNVLEKTCLFFIVGMGRSGTVFLSQLLNKACNVDVYHEAGCDFSSLVEAYWNPTKASNYLNGPRKRLVAARIMNSNCPTYGEVNSVLRYHVDAMQLCWAPTIFHLVRDGRSVVRSLMNRRVFTPDDEKVTGKLAPLSSDTMVERWPTMNRFERVCWYWRHANQFLIERKLPLIRLEEVVDSYDKFSHQVLYPLDIIIPYEIWKSEVSQPKNISKFKIFPPWKDWTNKQKHQFGNICGPGMAEIGYLK